MMFKKVILWVVVWGFLFELLGGGRLFQGTGFDSNVQLPDITPVFQAFSVNYVGGMAFVFVFGLAVLGWKAR